MRQAAEEHREAVSRRVHKELFEARADLIRNKQIGCYVTAFCAPWKMLLMLVGSRMPEVEPLEIWHDPADGGKNHIVRRVQGYGVHLIRWSADPTRMTANIFEPFPDAGARLDLFERLLFVERERDLFPDVFQSRAFCERAASLLMYCDRVARKEFTFRSQDPQWMTNLPGEDPTID